MEIREYSGFKEEEILRLYSEAGWTAYTDHVSVLKKGFLNSLFPDRRRQGIGTALVKALLDRFPGIRQIQLTADGTPELAAFYGSLGFTDLSEMGCRGYMKK